MVRGPVKLTNIAEDIKIMYGKLRNLVGSVNSVDDLMICEEVKV